MEKCTNDYISTFIDPTLTITYICMAICTLYKEYNSLSTATAVSKYLQNETKSQCTVCELSLSFEKLWFITHGGTFYPSAEQKNVVC